MRFPRWPTLQQHEDDLRAGAGDDKRSGGSDEDNADKNLPNGDNK